jgi:DAK2 domain fusion protein YloV
VLDALDGDAVRAWCDAALAALRDHQDEIDELNVYPVPDGDTGTNLVLTYESVVDALGAQDDRSLAAVGRAIARGSLLGARGNSGVIVSQWLRGLTEAPDHADLLGGTELAAAMRCASERADASVDEPVDGTVLSVARAAAEGAQAGQNAALVDVVRASSHAADQAVVATTKQLAALAEAGVVDAAGRGLQVILDALASTVTKEPGRSVAASPSAADAGGADRFLGRDAGRPGRNGGSALERARETGSPAYGYEVVYLLDSQQEAVRRLRARLGELGDSLAVVGDDSLWKVHVHVNDVGAAIEAGIDAGRPRDITVTRFADQQASADGASHSVGQEAIEDACAVRTGDG